MDWNDELSIGIEEIDAQHKVLIALVNRLNDAILERKGSAVTADILAELAQYTKTHFIVEESLMRILGYPDYDDHKQNHENLIQEILNLQEMVGLGKKSINYELLHFLRKWLTHHIMKSDKKLGTYLIKKGIATKYHKSSWLERILG